MAILNKRPAKRPEVASKAPELPEPNFMLLVVNRYYLWIIVLVMGIVLLLAYSFVVGAKVNELRNAAQEYLPAKQRILADLEAIEEDLNQVVVEFDLIRSQKSEVLQRLDALLPSDPGHAQLFTMLDELTDDNGLTMHSINIATSDARESVQRTDSRFQEAGVTSGSSAPTVKQLSISISVSGGTYESLKRYLDAIERNVRLFDLQSLSFDGGGFLVDSEGEPGVPQYSIQLITYYEDMTPEAPEPAAVQPTINDDES